MMARARRAAKARLADLGTVDVLRLLGGGGFGAVIVALLFYGVRVTIPTFLAMIESRDAVFRAELEKRDEKFTTGLRDQGDRAVSIIKDQQEKFAAELRDQRLANERMTDRLAASMDALRAAIERKDP